MAAITGSSLSTVYSVRHPHWLLSYAGKNISADVSKMVIEITYTDHESHLSDEIEVQLEDRDKRWQGPWYPLQGDSLNLQIGYADEPLLPCGNFEIDELELDAAPAAISFISRESARVSRRRCARRSRRAMRIRRSCRWR